MTLGGATAVFPPGFIAGGDAVEIRLQRTRDPHPRGIVGLSTVYQFLPSMDFARAVEVCLPVASAPADAAVYWSKQTAAGYSRLATTITGDLACARVQHFSRGFVGRSDRSSRGDGDGSFPALDGGGHSRADAGPGAQDALGGAADSLSSEQDEPDLGTGAEDQTVGGQDLGTGSPDQAVGRPDLAIDAASAIDGSQSPDTGQLGCEPSCAPTWSTLVGGNSQNNGWIATRGPQAQPRIRWQGSLKNVYSPDPPLVGRDLVVVNRIGGPWDSVNRRTLNDYIVGHDLQTGAVRWRTQLPRNFEDSWSSKAFALRDGRVYATRATNGGTQEYYYALDAETGAIVWRSDDLTHGGSPYLAFADNGDLLMPAKKAIIRVGHRDGKTLWRAPIGVNQYSAYAPVVFGNRVYVWDVHHKVTAIDLVTGKPLYSSEMITPSAIAIQYVQLMVGPDGTVYAPRYLTAVDNEGEVLVALRDTGSALVEKWRVPYGGGTWASLAVGPDGSVYTYLKPGEVARLNPATGAVIDRAPITIGEFRQRMAIDASGQLFVMCGGRRPDDGNGTSRPRALFAFSPNLTLRWKIDLPANASGPSLGPGGVLAISGRGDDLWLYEPAGS